MSSGQRAVGYASRASVNDLCVRIDQSPAMAPKGRKRRGRQLARVVKVDSQHVVLTACSATLCLQPRLPALAGSLHVATIDSTNGIEFDGTRPVFRGAP